jgi:aspartyl-tRNA(Asn)/glutamyl-tRNA(Gln) amidotransferase subunit B
LERQRRILESGGRVEQTTLHYDPDDDQVHELRSKEYAHDYRYFPEPDLLPLEITPAWIREIESRLPELPDQMRTRFMEQYGLSDYDAGVLVADRDLAVYFEKVAAFSGIDPKQAANWITVELRGRLNEAGIGLSRSKVRPERMAELIGLVADGTISRSAAKDVLDRILETGESPTAVVEREGLGAVASDELGGIVDEVISANPEEAERVRAGDKKVVGFLIGQVMRATRGNADGGRVRELLLQKLDS